MLIEIFWCFVESVNLLKMLCLPSHTSLGGSFLLSICVGGVLYLCTLHVLSSVPPPLPKTVSEVTNVAGQHLTWSAGWLSVCKTTTVSRGARSLGLCSSPALTLTVIEHLVEGSPTELVIIAWRNRALNIKDAVLNHFQRCFQVAIRRSFLWESPIVAVMAVTSP